MDEDDLGPWRDMAALQHLVELDLVTMKFSNVKALLTAVGPRLETLTLEMDEDQVSIPKSIIASNPIFIALFSASG